MKFIQRLIAAIWVRKSRLVVTVFPKGTIVHYGGIPCELLEDCVYYSATYASAKEPLSAPRTET